jgi:hypothetical protein
VQDGSDREELVDPSTPMQIQMGQAGAKFKLPPVFRPCWRKERD